MDGILEPYQLSEEVLRKLMRVYDREFMIGLTSPPETSTIAMLPSFLPALPDGSEKGLFIGLDLGGTNLRVLALTVEPDKPLEMSIESFRVCDQAMSGTGEQLFDFVAEKLDVFLTKHSLRSRKLSLGFVFSFPCKQSKLNVAKLLWWTKEYTCSGTIGEDVVQMLQSAIDRRSGLDVTVRALINDSVGCLAASAYEHGVQCLVAGVVSTGCNVSYVEKTAQIRKLDPKFNYAHPKMIIDTEWEEFGNNGQLDVIRTDIDDLIDSDSVHVGRQTQDKYIAGLHLGEHVRMLMLKAAKSAVFSDHDSAIVSQLFSTKDSLTAVQISECLLPGSNAGNLLGNKEVSSAVESALQQVVLPCACDSLCCTTLTSSSHTLVIPQTCLCVSLRSASILACALASLLVHIDQFEGLIGLGGSLFLNHPMYRTMVQDQLTTLLPDNFRWEIVPIENGSEKGSALVAAIVERLQL